ncbi:HD-GYP domain-containing protein [Clostridium felsineum]|uniref:HD-GYP domain-containing protein n=1 Tax=Clostridium felsineum TaxID=36839 RepID=UPI00214D3D6C|nr:HD-GYP domain-containing protein [Clostridium felsineum]MCR3758416.1 HD-GYP domain-containing protein [Clostridium felsineum]
MRISFEKIIRSVSLALDLAEISSSENPHCRKNISNVNFSNHKFYNHSKRTTYIALKLAKMLNLTDDSMKNLYIASLLHDIGAVNSLNESHTSSAFIRRHCVDGALITENLPIFNSVSPIIHYHHENSNGTGPFKLKSTEIPIESKIIHLADMVETIYDENVPAFKQHKGIINLMESNPLFDKDVSKAFFSVAQKEIFWFDMENISFLDSILDTISPNITDKLDLQQFESFAVMISDVIDSKSSFTARHSRSISNLAFRVSKYLRYSDEKCLKMKIAGLLHDIGKLAIPTTILDKNGSLTDDEFSIIKSHVYYTKIILDSIDNINDISEWASSHHEKLDGTGYPRHLSANELPEESRIMGVCDIYQALTEDRPYRKGMSHDKAFKILNDMADHGSICKKAVAQLAGALKAN